jgi:hypothetical protein
VDCEAAGGRYKGDGTTCTPLNPCFGACCFLDGSCTETLDAAECAGLGGTYRGDGTTCDPNLCPQPGNDCTNPMPLLLTPGGLPVVDTDTTCGRVNDYSNTCLGSYDGGEDIIYEVTVTDPMCVTIAVDGVLTWVGVAIDTACPPGATCLAYNTNSGGNPVIQNLNLDPGVYYIMIDTYPSPTCTDFTMTISACPTPGACCFYDATCEMLLPADCVTAGGVYQGEGTTCDPNLCEESYCPAGSTYTNCDEYISRVQVGTIDNATACSQPGGYGDYTALSTDLVYTIGTPITVTNGHPYSSDQCGIWIDWNQNMDFYDPGEQITVSGTPGVGPYSATIVPPPDAVSGPTRMRIRITYTGVVDPCGFVTYGEVEDYTVNIIEVLGACCLGDGSCTQELPSTCGGFYVGPFTECSGNDCQPNGIDDLCDIASGNSQDCDGNGVPDECQPFEDCNSNGIADFCDIAECDGSPWCSDCNDNGVLDECDILNGTSEDCQLNGVPDECDIAFGLLETGYDDGSSENSLGNGTYNHEITWIHHFTVPGPVAGVATTYGTPLYPGGSGVSAGDTVKVWVWSDPNGDGNPTDGVLLAEKIATADAAAVDTDVFQTIMLDTQVTVGASYFVGVSHEGIGFEAPMDEDEPLAHESWVLYTTTPPIDPNNLSGAQSLDAAGFPADWMLRVETVVAADCNDNGTPDECDVPPICEGENCSQDCNGDLVPDECQLGCTDCNGNLRPDDCDIASGSSLDCNGNGVPDECDLNPDDPDCNGQTSLDCQPDSIPDECQLAGNDCNGNGVPDDCDIASGASCDCQGDGIPDECQLFTARTVIWDNGPLATGETGCSGVLSTLQDSLGLTVYGYGAQQTAGNRMADDFTLSGACTIDTVTLYTYQTGSTPPTITGVYVQIWNGQPNAGGTVVWGDLTTNRLVSVTASGIYRTLPTVDCTRQVQTVVASVGTQLSAGTYWVDYTFTGSGASGPWAPPVTLLGQTGKPGANALQFLGDGTGWVAVLDGPTSTEYPQDMPFVIEGACGAPPNDCNENGIPDECDIGTQFGGFCADQGAPCFPAECSSDWNTNGVPDDCPDELCGDLNTDGNVDLNDYWVFVDAFGSCDGSPKYNAAADMDGDGCVTLLDYQAWRMCYKMANNKDFVAPKPKPVPLPLPKAKGNVAPK